MKTYLTFFIVIVLVVNYGCKKSDTLETDTGFTTVKVYDDTLASILNSSINIASGANRIYMTYGVGNSNTFQYINGLAYLINGSYAKLLALDNEGALIWQKVLPIDIKVDDMLALNDGGCMIAGYDSDPFSLTPYYLHFTRFNQNGEITLHDSLILQLPIAVNSIISVNLMFASNGNYLIYGSYYNSQFQQIGYLCEYDLNLNQVWGQLFYFGSVGASLNGCTVSADGGYLVAGGYISNTSVSHDSIWIEKTNATGDSLWARVFSANDYPTCNDVVLLSNGNYCLSIVNNPIFNPQTLLYEINTSGDSLNSARIDIANQKYSSALLPTENGGVFALMNSILGENTALNTWNSNYTSSVILDATLKSNSGGFFQTKTNELYTAACKTSDGKIACSGIIQVYGKDYYKPALLILK